jgi:hypothetical protein
MQAADEAGVRPKVLIQVSKGMVTIRSDTLLDLTVVDSDIEVRCHDVSHFCSAEELTQLLKRFSSFRHDRFFCKALASAD